MTDLNISSPRLRQLQEELQLDQVTALPNFWAELAAHGTPLIEPADHGNSLVTFIWRDDGTALNVAVLQDWGADGIREHHMARLPGTDVWHLTRRIRSDTRTTYQFSPSTSPDPNAPGSFQVDPLNPRTFVAYLAEAGGSNILFSLLELPDAPAMPWRQAPVAKQGLVQLHTPIADHRRLWVYMPPIPVTTPLPVLVIFDGRLYKDNSKLPEMLDYLIGTGAIPPMAALMVDNPDRGELLCKPEFADTMANEVIPWLRASYPITSDPAQTIIGGSSYGGLGATYLAFKHPTIFGTVLSQTGWFRRRDASDPEYHWLARQMAAAPLLPLRFWLQVGNLEVAKMADGGPTQLAANQHMRDVLQNKGYAVSYQEYSGGHDASSLEFPLAQALMEILNATH